MQSESRHVVPLANLARKFLQCPPHGIEHTVAVALTALAEMFEQPFGTELLIVLPKNLRHAVCIEEEARAFGKRKVLRRVLDAGKNAERRSARFNHAHGTLRLNHEAGIMTGVHHADRVTNGIELQKNSRNIATANLRSFVPVLL